MGAIAAIDAARPQCYRLVAQPRQLLARQGPRITTNRMTTFIALQPGPKSKQLHASMFAFDMHQSYQADINAAQRRTTVVNRSPRTSALASCDARKRSSRHLRGNDPRGKSDDDLGK